MLFTPLLPALNTSEAISTSSFAHEEMKAQRGKVVFPNAIAALRSEASCSRKLGRWADASILEVVEEGTPGHKLKDRMSPGVGITLLEKGGPGGGMIECCGRTQGKVSGA